MAFHDVVYDIYFVLGDPGVPPLWNWAVWEQLLSDFDPLMAVSRGKPAVRSNQYLPDQSGTVKFGRVGWNKAGHQKWTQGSPTNHIESSSWKFLDTEIWAPSWTACEREGRPPDVFLCLVNQALFGRKEVSFNPSLIFAVSSELADREVPLVSSAVSRLRLLMRPKLSGYKRRTWGLPIGSTGFTNSIQELAAIGLFKPGHAHRGEPEVSMLAEEWEIVDSVANAQTERTA